MADIFDCADPDQRSRGITSAVGALKAGRLVVMPTDTVYGIGADAFKSWSVNALQNAKGRGLRKNLLPDRGAEFVLARIERERIGTIRAAERTAMRQLGEKRDRGGMFP